MTSLGKLIFVNAHSRNLKSLSSEESANLDLTESLSLAFESLLHMPYDIIENYASTINTLDISHNKFSRNLQFLSEFDNLTSLNLDHNNIDAFTKFPYMPKLQLLWLNHNKIDELFPFVKNLYESFPNLRYLSLMGNKAAPSYLNGGSFYDYLQYRLVVISWFPRLVHLDDRLITSEQRIEATRLFRRPLLEQLSEHTPIPECIKVFHNRLSNFFIKSVIPDKLRMPKSSNFII
ncbi:leucine-rich melanocyte differentiation-associated protein-like isoform X2 [Belonocnema kinseyi]|nr:leucine-rich melanocyte differentiation-associated protein-like isoform X2 [Belonocnema kinseyi]